MKQINLILFGTCTCVRCANLISSAMLLDMGNEHVQCFVVMAMCSLFVALTFDLFLDRLHEIHPLQREKAGQSG